MRDALIVNRISALVAEFGKDFSKPELKFLSDLIFGVLCSRSSFLSEIARAIAPKTEVKAVWKRLDINLGKYDLSKPYARAQTKILRKVDESFLFIFDPSEIVKPFGKKMEGLALVRDASERPRYTKDSEAGKFVERVVLKPGYKLRVAVAMSPKGDILPIELSMYSSAAEDFVSQNESYVNVLETLMHQSNFAPTLVLDREFDSFIIIRHLCKLRQRFVIRMKKTRKYRVPGSVWNAETYTREEITGKHAFLEAKAEIAYTVGGETKSRLFEIRAANVEFYEEGTDDSFRDKGDLRALTLVEVKIHKDDAKGIAALYLLTNVRPTTQEDLQWIAKSYLARWNIEEYIRFLKQHFALESFLVRDLGRMKNLISAIFIATVIMHSITDNGSYIGYKIHQFLIDRSLEVVPPKKFRDFFLYAYGRGLSNLVESNKRLLKTANARQKDTTNSDPNQLSFL